MFGPLRFGGVLLGVSILSCCSDTEQPRATAESQSATSPSSVSRKDELILEGLINDYCYRQMVKGTIRHVRCYAAVSPKDVIVYVYPSESWSLAPLALIDRDFLKENLAREIPAQFMGFPDWAWAKAYKLTIVDRTLDEVPLVR